MDSFYDLVSESFTKREEAARNVLQFAREDDGKQLEYVLNRLARGIKSAEETRGALLQRCLLSSRKE